MAHFAKYNRSQVGHLGKHYKREKKENGEYIKFGNQDIDTTRTNLNYNLAPALNKTHLEKINEIVQTNQYKLQNRKDVNVMCSCVVTLPAELHEASSEKQREFFETSYDFLSQRYGEKNVISSFVHNDETTPHMHFSFVPVVKDKKKNIYKVSAKELLNKRELSIFHQDFQKYLDKELSSEVKILNNATKEGNKSISELKAISELTKDQKNSLKQHFREYEDEIARNIPKTDYQPLQKEWQEMSGEKLIKRSQGTFGLKKEHLANNIDKIITIAKEQDKVLEQKTIENQKLRDLSKKVIEYTKMIVKPISQKVLDFLSKEAFEKMRQKKDKQRDKHQKLER